MHLGGPQSSRDKTWLRPPGELSEDREDLALDKDSERQVYEGELARVRKENVSLRDQLQRTLKELRHFQVKYPSEHIDVRSDENLPPWATSADVMTPLLRAYDSRIAELESMVEQQSGQLESFHEKVEEILAENEALREAQIDNLKQNGGGSTLGPLNMELLNELNERVEILMSENALLVEQKAVLSTELEESLSELEARTNTVTELSEQLGEVAKEVQSLKQRNAQAERDREAAAAQALSYSDSLGRAQIEVSDLREQLDVWEERCSRAEGSVSALEKQLKGVIAQAEEDGHTAMRRLKGAEDRVKELHSLLLRKTQDLDSAQEVARKLRREYQATRQDAEGMLQVMGGLERQLSEYAAREGEVERASRESKERVEEALVARDQAVAREEQLKREVERLLDERKKAAVKKQSEIDSAVEVARSVATSQLASLESEIEELTARVAKHRGEEERAGRELRSAQALLEKARHSFDEDRRASEQGMAQLESRIRAVVSEREDALVKLKAVQDLNTELRLTIDRLRTQDESQRLAAEESRRSRDKEMEVLRASLREHQREAVECAKLATKRGKELEDIKKDTEERINSMLRLKDEEVSAYRRRASEAEHAMKEMETVASAEDHRVKILVDQFKEKANITAAQMETKLRESREKAQRLADQNREIENVVKALEAEKGSLLSQLQDARNKISQLQGYVKDCERDLAELTAQLAASFEAREESAKRSVNRFCLEESDDDDVDENDVDNLLSSMGE